MSQKIFSVTPLDISNVNLQTSVFNSVLFWLNYIIKPLIHSYHAATVIHAVMNFLEWLHQLV